MHSPLLNCRTPKADFPSHLSAPLLLTIAPIGEQKWCAAEAIRSQGAPFYVSIQPLCIWALCLILAIYISDKGIYKVFLSSQGLQAMCSCSRGKAKVRLSLAALVPVTIVLTTASHLIKGVAHPVEHLL